MHKILHSGFFSPWRNLNLFTRKSLLSNTLIEKNILHDLPSNFEDLQIPVHIFCSDIFALVIIFYQPLNIKGSSIIPKGFI